MNMKNMNNNQSRETIEEVFKEYDDVHPEFRSIMNMPMSPKFRVAFDKAIKDHVYKMGLKLINGKD